MEKASSQKCSKQIEKFVSNVKKTHRLRLTEYANITGDYGWQLGNIGGTQKDHRGHLRVALQY